ncbi:hypothetical protein RCC89_02725 [Cytophagaceae bacterium ABcell3]|nr:hypothetical protein RCC89_02725 [Cytophagaceae bacterium ABcell3]
MDFLKDSKLKKVELTLSFVLSGVLLFFIGQNINSFLFSSLWCDELYTVLHFTSKGALNAVTDYHVPNNHIFFSLINSIIPGYDSVEPARARMFSFISLLAFIFFAYSYFYNLKQYLLAPVFLFFLYSNSLLLDLVLQARGYGLLSFFILVSCICVYKYFRDGGRLNLLLLCISCVLAVYTIPTSVVFYFFLWVLLLTFAEKRKGVFISAAISGFVVALVHIPVLGQLLEVSSTYADGWGRQFGSLSAIKETIFKFSFLKSYLDVFIVLVCCVVASFSKSSTFSKPALTLFFSVLLSLLVFRLLETPIPRTVAFVLIVLFFVALHAINKLSLFPKLRLFSLLLIFAFSFIHSIYSIRAYQYTPYENWKGVASFIEQNVPEGTEVYCPFRSILLKAYLPESYPIVTEPNDSLISIGKQTVVDGDFLSKDGLGVNLSNSYPIAVPQIRGDKQVIYLPENYLSEPLNKVKVGSIDSIRILQNRYEGVSYDISCDGNFILQFYSSSETSIKGHKHVLFYDEKGELLLYKNIDNFFKYVFWSEHHSELDPSKVHKVVFRVKGSAPLEGMIIVDSCFIYKAPNRTSNGF